jgi:hypothetical protein
LSTVTIRETAGFVKYIIPKSFAKLIAFIRANPGLDAQQLEELGWDYKMHGTLYKAMLAGVIEWHVRGKHKDASIKGENGGWYETGTVAEIRKGTRKPVKRPTRSLKQKQAAKQAAPRKLAKSRRSGSRNQQNKESTV